MRCQEIKQGMIPTQKNAHPTICKLGLDSTPWLDHHFRPLFDEHEDRIEFE